MLGSSRNLFANPLLNSREVLSQLLLLVLLVHLLRVVSLGHGFDLVATAVPAAEPPYQTFDGRLSRSILAQGVQ